MSMYKFKYKSIIFKLKLEQGHASRMFIDFNIQG